MRNNKNFVKALVEILVEKVDIIDIDSVSYKGAVVNDVVLPLDHEYEDCFVEWCEENTRLIREQEALEPLNKIVERLGGNKVLPKPPKEISGVHFHPLWMVLSEAERRPEMYDGDEGKMLSFTLITEYIIEDIIKDIRKFKHNMFELVDEYNVDYQTLVVNAIVNGKYDDEDLYI